MSCQRFRPAIAAHAGGAEIEAAAAQHLGACATCRQLLDTQRQVLAELDAELGRTLSITASPEFVAKVSRATADAGAVPARPWIPAPIWAGLALAAAVVLAAWLRQPAGTDPARPVQSSAEAKPAASFRLKAEATPSIKEDVPSARVERRRSVGVQRPVVGSGSFAIIKTPASAKALATAEEPGRHATPTDPPVIVDPSRALALERLRELMLQRRLDERMLPPPVTPEAALAELTIAPLAIAEIQVPGVEIVGHPPAAPQRQ